MNVEIENIASKRQKDWRPMHEVIYNPYFAATKLSPTDFYTNVEIIQITLRTYHIKSK